MLKSIQISSRVRNVEITYDFSDRLEIRDVQYNSGVDRVEVDKAEGRVFIHQFVSPGDTYELRLKGTESDEMFGVAVKCFVGPPPPVYRPCPDCGVVSIKSDSYVKFTANVTAFDSRKQSFEGKARAVELVIGDESPHQQRVSLGLRSEGFDIFDRIVPVSEKLEIVREVEKSRFLER